MPNCAVSLSVVSQCCKPPGLKSDILGGNYLLLRAATSRFIAYLVQSLLYYITTSFCDLQVFFSPSGSILSICQFRRFQPVTFVHISQFAHFWIPVISFYGPIPSLKTVILPSFCSYSEQNDGKLFLWRLILFHSRWNNCNFVHMVCIYYNKVETIRVFHSFGLFPLLQHQWERDILS